MSNFNYFQGTYTESVEKGYIGRQIYFLDSCDAWTIDGKGKYATAQEAIKQAIADDEATELSHHDY
jgi:hypothetical protein